MKQKIVVVGGVAGGATLVARLRRLSEDFEIIMFEKDEYIAFANCGLPYYIGGVIEDRDKLKVQTVEGVSTRYNIDIRNMSEVTNINEESKTVTVVNHKTGETYEESYDKLVLSPGASPIVPPFAGLKDATNAFTLRNIPDTDAIKGYVDTNKPKTAVVIGGGFIGVEMAENLAHLGIEVTLIDLADHILKPFDSEMAAMLEYNLKSNGVDLLTGTSVSDVTNDYVEINDGTRIDTDLTILAIGVRPSTKLAEGTSIELAKNGAFVVNEKFETSSKDIYALGDAINITNPILENEMHIPLAWPANRQARILADIFAGYDKKYNGTIGASVLKVNELTAAATGYTEELLDIMNVEHDSVIVHRGSRAGYYPGGSNMSLKLVFNNEGTILGAQAIGTDGVEKRIDVITTAIKFGAKVTDLEDIEVCYAPPFNSAKDPVNIAGYTAVNVLTGFSKTFKYDQLEAIATDENKVLIDVRTKEEVEFGNVEGAINVDVDDIRSSIADLEQYKDKEIYVFCQLGHRGYIAQKILNANGFDNVYNLSGGLNTYKAVKNNQNKTSNKIEQVTTNIEVDTIKGDVMIDHTLNACGLQCPGPIMATSKKMDEMKAGETLEIRVTDSGFIEDIKSWCDKCGNELVSQQRKDNTFIVVIRKTEGQSCHIDTNANKDNGTIVMFSGDMDKALGAMIIAQGAQAMGKQMTVFFTFWGLNMLRKEGNVEVDKTNFEKMFGAMMPQGADKLPLSNMNMGGIGTKMIKGRMEDKNVPDLKTQMQNALDSGVKFIACTMSMDLMGIKEEELIDGVEFGGVAKYIGESSGADLTLFI
ncbi:FAD-dependent oxidoreductase [Mollicutes bacterium LVI A0078]|nr:FAD-dependent oxidoreductase [Mollicutes bacterium LVI A0075]WOO91585.1 FAD-dependent oxidoreductase [Mollicutes bacterium LVI A0078]